MYFFLACSTLAEMAGMYRECRQKGVAVTYSDLPEKFS
jgi:hypothetical protein